MKTKTFVLVLLTAILLTASASALGFSASTPGVLTKGDSSSSFTITNTGTEDINVSLSTPSAFSDGTNTFTPTLNQSSITDLAGSGIATISVSRGTVPSDFKSGVYTSDLTATASNGSSTSNSTVTLTFVKDFCKNGSINDTNMDLGVSIKNRGTGTSTSWTALDQIEVTVKLDNQGDNDVKNVMLEIGLIEKSTGKNVASDLIWADKDQETFDARTVNSGKSVKHVFTFKVDPSIAINSGDYLLFVKAYSDGKENNLCVDHSSDLDSTYYQEISIDTESDNKKLVMFDDVQVAPNPVLCGGDVTVTAKVYNIGSDDQNKVKATLSNTALGINLYAIIDSLDSGDSSTVEFTFSIPKNATEKKYDLEMDTMYGYDDSYTPEEDNAYNERSDVSKVSLEVQGNCAKTAVNNAEISAVLGVPEADVKAGASITIDATVKNTGSTEATYTMSVEGNELFSTTESINPSVFTLGAGESKQVPITLKINSDAEGDKVFNIVANSAGGSAVKQAVSLSIPASWTKTFGLSSIKAKLADNWFIWVIIAVNIILILAIIIVAVKVTRA